MDEETRESVERLSRDLAKAAATLTREEARYLVDAYYLIQHNRIAAGNQIRAMSDSEEPVLLLHWLADQNAILEAQVKRALDKYSLGSPTGEWARGILGVGPVICAGLLAHIDIQKAPTAGHIWNFAGLNPGVEWAKGRKRPWNADLKTLCWKLGESFVKVSGNPKSFYGGIFKERKAQELARNVAGELAEQAADKLGRFKIGKTTQAHAFYAGRLPVTVWDGWSDLTPPQQAARVKAMMLDPGVGTAMLPPAHIHARAKRWAVKLFLSHLHAIWYENVTGQKAPVPYAIAHLGHAHLIAPPGEG
jgi:hypothetical protein